MFIQSAGWCLCTSISTSVFHTCCAYGYHWLLPYYATFSDLDLTGITRSAQSKSCWFIFPTCFLQLMRMKFSVVLKQFKLDICILLLSEIYWIKGNSCCFSDSIKNLNISMHSDVYGLIQFKHVVIIRHYWTQHVHTNLSDFDLESRSLECKKAKLSVPVVHSVLNCCRWKLMYCWDLLVWWTSYSFYFIPSIFKGESATS